MRKLAAVLLSAVLIGLPTGARALIATDAEALALEISGALLPPPDMVATITTDIEAIKAAYPYLDPCRPSPPWVPGNLIVALTPDGWAAYTSGAGYCLDDLNTSLGGWVARTYNAIECLFLQFAAPYHPERLAEMYSPLGCVRYADPNGYWSQPVYDINSTELSRYTFVMGFDCAFPGYEPCDSYHYWTFTVTAGVVHLEASWGDPLPELTAVPGALPTALTLHQNHPNPFNPRTTIPFDLPAGGRVRLAVYDIAGRLVNVLVDGAMSAGSHNAVWDGRDSAGRGMGSGSYFARLQAGGRVETVRMGLVR